MLQDEIDDVEKYAQYFERLPAYDKEIMITACINALLTSGILTEYLYVPGMKYASNFMTHDVTAVMRAQGILHKWLDLLRKDSVQSREK